MRLSDEQRKLAEDNHLLVYKYMSNNRLDEDWYDIIVLGYLRGIYTWEGDKSNLATWVYYNMRYAMLDELNRKHYKNPKIDRDGNKVYKRKMGVISYDNLRYEVDGLYTEDCVDLLIDLSNKINNFTYIELRVLYMLMMGHTVTEIANELNMSRQYIYKVRGDILYKVKSKGQIMWGKGDKSNGVEIESYRVKCRELISEYMV